MNGYILIRRALFEHPFWGEERCFSRFEALFYLIIEARFEDTKVYLANKVFVVKRGQLSVSLRFLSVAFGCSTKKVKNLLKALESSKEITIETPKETGQTLITICKYDYWTNVLSIEETQKETVRKQQGNSEETKLSNYNKDNKDNTLLENQEFLLNQVKEIESNETIWLEWLSRSNQIDLEFVSKKLLEFVNTLVEREEGRKEISELKRHFSSWLKLNKYDRKPDKRGSDRRGNNGKVNSGSTNETDYSAKEYEATQF